MPRSLCTAKGTVFVVLKRKRGWGWGWLENDEDGLGDLELSLLSGNVSGFYWCVLFREWI